MSYRSVIQHVCARCSASHAHLSVSIEIIAEAFEQPLMGLHLTRVALQYSLFKLFEPHARIVLQSWVCALVLQLHLRVTGNVCCRQPHYNPRVPCASIEAVRTCHMCFANVTFI